MPLPALLLSVLISPEVRTDDQVTFRLRRPTAEAVSLDMEGLRQPIPFHRDSDGTWTLTTGPLRPDIYGYDFLVDGHAIADPSNPARKPNLLSVESTFCVPGQPPMPWEMTDVPHGKVDRIFYSSKACADTRDYLVYTPPRYDPSRRYPLLLLLHGFSDDAGAWIEYGKANLILDRLLAEGHVVPMIVVMPLGYGTRDILKWKGPGRWPADLVARNLGQFEASLMDEVLPRVAADYSLSDARAIVGLSMGGTEALLVGLGTRGAEFGWIGAFSPGGLPERALHDAPNATRRVHSLWLSCGSDDGLNRNYRILRDAFGKQGFSLSGGESAGGHSWQVWRRNFIALAPQLFRVQPNSGPATAP